MAEYKGKLLVCDRCGDYTFLKTIGDGEADGGFTRWNKFETAEGWTSEYGIGNLCPGCSKSYEETRRMFTNGVLGAPIIEPPSHSVDTLIKQ